MGTRSVEANPGITPTIEHLPTGIVHHLPPAEAAIEIVPRVDDERLKRTQPTRGTLTPGLAIVNLCVATRDPLAHQMSILLTFRGVLGPNRQDRC